MIEIKNRTYDEERALYHLQDAVVENCIFAGEADGESALKETGHIFVKNCRFALRYPLWHATGFSLQDSKMEETCRAPLWYTENGEIAQTEILSVKCLRECRNLSLQNCKIISPEFGWKCKNITLEDCTLDSEYAFLQSEKVKAEHLQFKGKYSFQYVKNVQIENSTLDTKDAFWHAENVTVKNCVVKGEYLGWYSKNLTLIDCEITGTQPFCYCKNLHLENCTMADCDLAFEHSTVHATVKGNIPSVKNPTSGKIVADSIGETILENAVTNINCKIITKE